MNCILILIVEILTLVKYLFDLVQEYDKILNYNKKWYIGIRK